MTTDSAVYLIEFHQQLNEHFNLEEIRTLCFKLHIDYETISGDEKSSRIRELLLAMGRYGRLSDLIKVVREERPNVDWPSIPDNFQLPESLAPEERVVSPDQYNVYGDVVQGDIVAGNKIEGNQNVFVGKHGVNVPGSVGRDVITGTKIENYYTNPNPQNVEEQRVRAVLLEKVQKYWVEGVLGKSLHHLARIDLRFESKNELVERPWMLEIAPQGFSPEDVPSNVSVLTLANKLGGDMLILGDPGSGKTTTLLEIARDLILEAKQDDSLQIPIVVNLSSWAQKQLSLEKWLIQELHKTYQTNRNFSQNWLNKEPFILLLDGLDEVAEVYREACITAINTFRANHGSTKIFVCSRLKDYEILPQKLQFTTAVVIKPLSRTQVQAYLVNGGERLASVYQKLKMDDSLWELAQSPLMLSIMTLAYQNMPVDELVVGNSQDHHNRLLTHYIERMFSRKPLAKKYDKEQATHWLSFLASQLQKHNQPVYYIESMQLSWLSSKEQIWYRFVIGFFIGSIFGLISGSIFGTGVGILVGLLVSLIAGITPKNIETTDSIQWSWGKSKQALLIGLMAGLLGSNIGWVFGGVLNTVFGGTLGILYIVLIVGLDVKKIETKFTPNQGVIFSLKNFAWLGILFGITFCITFGIVGLLLGQLIGGRVVAVYFGVFTGILFGFVGGLSIVLFGGLINELGIAPVGNGGNVVIQHYLLRFFLSYRNYLPGSDLVVFLNDMDDHILLRKVGGGYIFAHRVLLGYFANLWLKLNKTSSTGGTGNE